MDLPVTLLFFGLCVVITNTQGQENQRYYNSNIPDLERYKQQFIRRQNSRPAAVAESPNGRAPSQNYQPRESYPAENSSRQQQQQLPIGSRSGPPAQNLISKEELDRILYGTLGERPNEKPVSQESVAESQEYDILTSCDSRSCRLPNCFCPTTKGPSFIKVEDRPQIVTFTFDDAINEQNLKYYQRLFSKERTNPDDCPVAATYYLSHEWTNYDMVKHLYLRGHEIASHSISHRTPANWWSSAKYTDWVYEIEGQRKNIIEKASIPQSQIKGVRVPFLEIGGDIQYKMLTDYKFEYDSSFMVGPYSLQDTARRKPLWPFTLDFPPLSRDQCDNRKCPTSNFSSFWEFPLNRWIGSDGMPCSMVDGCVLPKTHAEALQYLWSNFNRHYKNGKTPFGINMHATWFVTKHNIDAMEEFLESLLKMDDVYVITVSEAMEWLKRPVPLKMLNDFKPWQNACSGRKKLVSKLKKKRVKKPLQSSKKDKNKDDDGEDKKKVERPPQNRREGNNNNREQRLDDQSSSDEREKNAPKLADDKKTDDVAIAVKAKEKPKKKKVPTATLR